MTVRLAAGTIYLEGECSVEDGASLLQYLELHPHSTVDWTDCEAMHTAVFQVLHAIRPPLKGTPAGQFVATHLAPLLQQQGGEPGAVGER